MPEQKLKGLTDPTPCHRGTEFRGRGRCFSTIEPEMLDIVREFADHRAKLAREALALSQGGALPDRCRNLSRHRKAELLGETMPHVQGADHRRTKAYNARALAPLEEQM